MQTKQDSVKYLTLLWPSYWISVRCFFGGGVLSFKPFEPLTLFEPLDSHSSEVHIYFHVDLSHCYFDSLLVKAASWHLPFLAQSAGVVEYTNFISAEG